MHTDVRPTDRRGVMYLGSSWVTLAIFIVGVRSALRRSLVDAASRKPLGTIGDGLLAFAIAFIAASYAVIFRKYERLAKAQPSLASR